MRTRYPLGAEKQIVQTVTGREVPPGGTPLDAKCLVINVAPLFAIYEALFKSRALTHRTVTITGGAVARPRNLWVPIGTPLRRVLEACGGLREEADRHAPGRPGCPCGQEYQRSRLPDPQRAAQNAPGVGVHPLRQMRSRLSHASDPHLYRPGSTPERTVPPAQTPSSGLSGVRLLLLLLPRPYPSAGVGPAGADPYGRR